MKKMSEKILKDIFTYETGLFYFYPKAKRVKENFGSNIIIYYDIGNGEILKKKFL